MNEIGIFNETKEQIEELQSLQELLTFATQKEQISNCIFNVIIIDNERIRKLNYKYRGIDRETDVISFALEDETEYFIKEEIRVLGDIYISIDKAREQAELYGHSLKRELSFLAIHGLLHLLGYDHMNPGDEKIMFERQELILSEYGIPR